MKEGPSPSKIPKIHKSVVVNFSIYLSIGNMDKAFKSIETIKSEHVWENMAMML